MKHTTSIKSLLGFSQEEMAILLSITRSQWAMYETGKRDLPLGAKKQVASILLHLQNAKGTSKESQRITALEQKKTAESLEQELLTIAYKKQILDKQLLAMENKRAECFAALEVVHFLETQKPETDKALLKSIKLRVTNALKKNALHHLQGLQIKKEQFEMLKNSLEQKRK
jgi:transcriptional regulator with XRE-family HTH domain